MRLACWRSRPRVRELSVRTFFSQRAGYVYCFGKNCFRTGAEPTRLTRALSRGNCELKNFTRAAPGKCEASAAVTVIVNNGATVGETIAFDAHA